MPETPPTNPSPAPSDGDGRLQRCIRDLAALNALPSMCVGRTPEETLDIVMDALPTALSCDFVYVSFPGSPPKERACLRGAPLVGAPLADVVAAMAADADGADAQVFLGAGRLWCLEAEIPIGAERGRLITGRSTPLDPATDRVLVRSAANVLGVTFETAAVLEAARRKDDFLAMLGHELRNPLAPILTAVELLGRNASAVRERTIIERHTRHLARLVDDMLDISRVTRGNIELRNEHVLLASVLERAAEIASLHVSRKRHTVQIARADGVTLQGDPVRLAQIFGNLLTNAAKFTPEGGHIDVLVTPAPGRVSITVRDNGRGIAPDQMGRIFEPFVQVDSERDALHGGLGLGLAIVNNLVERHGGKISARSAGLGRGASFTVDLPTVARSVNITPLPHPMTRNARAGIRLLIVDDNVDVAELLSEALLDEGFETAVAHDGPTALALWPKFDPHAAVLDVGLPVLDGYELARALRAAHGTAPTLIAATGYGQDKDRLRAVDAGFDCHFVKPVSLQDLLRTIDQRVVAGGRGDRPATAGVEAD